MRPFKRSPIATTRARTLRQGENTAEGALWNVLKAKQLSGHKFVRQHPIGPYYADFAERSAKLVIEIDGNQHVGSPYDRERDEYMRKQGYSVLRVWSHDVLRRRSEVCDTILAALDGKFMCDVVAQDMRFVLAGPLRQLR
jgi:very-short-patch-repair endonuclease